MSGCGPTLPTWALQQVVGYRGYSARDANVVAEAALDPEQTSRPRETDLLSFVNVIRLRADCDLLSAVASAELNLGEPP